MKNIPLLLFIVVSCGRSSSEPELSAVGDIDRMTRRSDGLYNVVCRDGRRQVVSKDEILADKVCEKTTKSIIISSGTYKVSGGDSLGTRCEQAIKTIYEGSSLKKVYVRSVGTCVGLGRKELLCSGNLCRTSDGNFSLRVLKPEVYQFVQRRTSKTTEFKFANHSISPDATHLGKWKHWVFYKVKAKGKMIDNNVLAACRRAGLKTPCYGGRYKDSLCVDLGNRNEWALRGLAEVLCRQSTPTRCPKLENVYQYMGNKWSTKSSCGVYRGRYCDQGSQRSNLFALCMK